MKRLYAFIVYAAIFTGLSAQLQSVEGIRIRSGQAENKPFDIGRRSALKPTACKTDTSYFVQYGNKGYRFVTLRSGSSLGQFYGAPQELTIS